MDHAIMNTSRRSFLKAGAGLSLGVWFGPATSFSAQAEGNTTFAPNAFLRIGSDNVVTIVAKHAEIGQGVYTGLATIVAEELDAAWAQVRVEGAPADAKRYANGWMPGLQLTGGSTSMPASYTQMRQAGAAARQMLVTAAAKRWQVPTAEIQVREGVVSHPASARKLSFGELASDAAKESVPQEVQLKDPKNFRLIGKKGLIRKDAREKSNGSAIYGLDVRLPGMLTAVVAHPPRIGATVTSFNAERAKSAPDVVGVFPVPSGVAVVARTTWAAIKGREALSVEWDESKAFRLGSGEIFAQYRALLAKPGVVARKEGDVEQAWQSGAQKLEAEFELPYLAHATMEPMDCVVRLAPDGCELWNGEQVHTLDQADIAKALGLKPEQVAIHSLYAGGSFGRRYTGGPNDYVMEAVHIARAIGTGVPVKLVRTREDDMHGGYYRPLYLHRLRAALDARGNVVAWQHRVVGQSVVEDSFFSMMIKDGVDPSTLEGAMTLPYAIPNLMVDLHSTRLPVTVNSMRSVGAFHNAFAVESFIDELAHAARRDPLELRRALLKGQPRFLAVLDLAAAKSGWTRALRPGKPGERRGRGIAVSEWQHGTIVVHVAEVTVQRDGSYRVDRVVSAVDCGLAINPDIVRDQIEGAVAFGLSAAMMGKISLKDGVIEQSNFHDYPVLRMNEMPQVEVHIVASTAAPTGIGEPGVPPVAPALGNALFAATGKRLRSQPFDKDQLKA